MIIEQGRGMRPYHLVLLAFSTACAPKAFTPSARPMPIGTAQAPAPGEHDVQLDGNASGEVLGPGITSGHVRYRRGVADGLAVTGDVGLLRVSGDESSEVPFAGMSRVGVHRHGHIGGDADDLVAAAFAGVGGGHAPAAGSWVSSDVGGMVTGTHRWIRPTFIVDAYVSQPFATEVFEVGGTMLRMPRTYGVQGLFGFDLGPTDSSVMVGIALAQLWASANDVQDATSATFVGLGGGFRFAAN